MQLLVRFPVAANERKNVEKLPFLGAYYWAQEAGKHKNVMEMADYSLSQKVGRGVPAEPNVGALQAFSEETDGSPRTVRPTAHSGDKLQQSFVGSVSINATAQTKMKGTL